MPYLPNLPYPDREKAKLADLERLFRAWHRHFADNGSELEKHEQKANYMVFDGFYPNYFTQSKKLLFVGREPRQLAGCNYIETLHGCYAKGEVGGRPLNCDKFHRRMLKVAHGILNGMPEWREIPNANEIGETFAGTDGLSFAFMNISKLSNESDDPSANWPMINTAYTLSTQSRNFLQEQVFILEPDLVITMNLIDFPAVDHFESLGRRTPIPLPPECRVPSFWLEDYDGYRPLLIDAWHFSGNKTDIEGYYTPICDAIKRSQASPKSGVR